jgi:phosphohistidine phosphatase SixA
MTTARRSDDRVVTAAGAYTGVVTSPPLRRSLLAALALLAVLLAAPPRAAAEARLWSVLRGGGHVILVRHALTTPGVGDPTGMRLDDCGTQRNLSEEGRRDARALGEAFRARGIAVERVLTSPWCRCIETAQLAFGAGEPWPALGNLYGRPEHRARQVTAMQALVGTRGRGGNLVLVSHGSTIAALTGVAPDTSEMVIVAPQGSGRFEVIGRLVAHRP